MVKSYPLPIESHQEEEWELWKSTLTDSIHKEIWKLIKKDLKEKSKNPSLFKKLNPFKKEEKKKE